MSAFLGSDEDYKDIAGDQFEDTSSRDIFIGGCFIIFVNLGMVWIHKATSKKSNANEIQLEVNEAVAQYFALRGEEATNETA